VRLDGVDGQLEDPVALVVGAERRAGDHLRSLGIDVVSEVSGAKRRPAG
jgi:hypothetical protein